MYWDQLATVAQLVTGVATLAVAVFLWNQLKVQHRDSDREFTFANENRQQNMNMALFGDEPTAQVYWKGATAWESLTPEEAFRFKFLQQQRYLNNWNAWRLKRDGANTERFRQQWIRTLSNRFKQISVTEWIVRVKWAIVMQYFGGLNRGGINEIMMYRVAF